MNLDCFEHKMWHHCMRMEFSKVGNFLDTTSDDKDLTRFVTKKRIDVYINQEKITMSIKKLELKHQC